MLQEIELKLESNSNALKDEPKHTQKYQELVKEQIELLEQKKKLVESEAKELHKEIVITEFANRSKRYDAISTPILAEYDKKIDEYGQLQSKCEEDSLEYKMYAELKTSMMTKKADLLAAVNREVLYG